LSVAFTVNESTVMKLALSSLARAAVTLALTALAAGSALAQAKPAVIFDMGGKFDKSFNQSAYDGAEKWKKDTGKPYLEFEISNDTQRVQAIRRMAERGASPIISVGFAQASALAQVAKEFPKTHFAIIDAVVDAPNVQSLLFKEHEGSYLVGAMAVLASKTGKVGFVGGMDIPLIRKFQCGYEQGAKATNPKAEVFSNMTGTTSSAWNDPTRGGNSPRARTSSSLRPAAPAPAFTRPPRMPASWPSVWTATRTACSPARC
jgi:basic membrane protein A